MAIPRCYGTVAGTTCVLWLSTQKQTLCIKRSFLQRSLSLHKLRYLVQLVHKQIAAADSETPYLSPPVAGEAWFAFLGTLHRRCCKTTTEYNGLLRRGSPCGWICTDRKYVSPATTDAVEKADHESGRRVPTLNDLREVVSQLRRFVPFT